MSNTQSQQAEVHHVLFFTSAAAFLSERKAKEAKISARLVPVPRHLSSDCGVCLCLEKISSSQIESFLTQNKIPYDSIH